MDNDQNDHIADEQSKKWHIMLSEMDKELLEESVAAILSDIEPTADPAIDPGKFVMYRNLDAELIGEYRVTGLSSEAFLFVAAAYIAPTPKANNGDGSADIFLGYIRLNNAYPKTYICRETVREKIMDFFLRKETDFPEHQLFSKSFYLLTQEPEALRNLLRLAPLDELTKFPDLELELHDRECLFRVNAQPVSQEGAEKLLQLTRLLARILQ